MYIFPRSEDAVGQRPEGVHALIERYCSAGITSIAHDFEMLHELNRREVFTNVPVWISGILEMSS